MDTEVLIVGGGLAGLALADRLQRAGQSYLLIEARERFGGRILSLPTRASRDDDPGSVPRHDLGPTWYWPGQPLMQGLVDELGLGVFEQFASGTLVFEERDGAVRRDLDYSTMAGSLRVRGGVASLIDALAVRLPVAQQRLGVTVRALQRGDGHIVARTSGAAGDGEIRAQRVVLALPPRVAARQISFSPALGEATMAAMHAMPTWMAGHAKVVVVYKQPFWRAMGLSGDGVSHRGPLVEIHDASCDPGSDTSNEADHGAGDNKAASTWGALFGFVGVPAAARRGRGDELVAQAVRQLTALFGAQAADPLDVLLQDWACEPLTCVPADAESNARTHHPSGPVAALNTLWDERLLLGASEMAVSFPGYLEGALDAAHRVARQLMQGPSRGR